MERIKLALMFANARGKKSAKSLDYFLADQFLNSGMMLEHDRKIQKEAIEDVACRIPDTVDNLQSGESATHWLQEEAAKL